LSAAKYVLYLVGLGGVVHGAWMMYPPAGWIVGGGLAILVSMAIDHAKEKGRE
jgi:hypothetical protein